MIVFLKWMYYWTKRNWKWILFPVGAAIALAGYIAGRSKKEDTPTTPDLGDAGETAVDATVAANEERDRKLEELREKNQARLEELSGEQQKELDELKNKSLEEVVAWFDKI
jgi:hypothetical protein